MRDDKVQGQSLNAGRLVTIFAIASVAFVAVLAVAPVRPYFAEWRRVQMRYNARAAQAGASQIPIALQQIWKPQLGLTDRCVTCHLGMGNAGPVPGDPLFAAHPTLPHDPKEFGCTVCHGGQGRATTAEAAHGFVSHWDEAVLEGQHLQAGCGTCHDQFPAATRAQLQRGRHLVESLDCLSCHRVDGRGRGDGPDLTYVGLRGFADGWHEDHLRRRAAAASGPWRESYGEVSPEEQAGIARYLETRVGAPRIVEARAVAAEKGCLGCHKVGGRGGDEGPALDAVGRKPTGDLSFAHVDGPETLTNYLRTHLLDPPGVVPGSLMPIQALTAEDADLLTSWLLFLRRRDLPVAYLPADRVRRELLGAARPVLSGEEAYLAYCSACHGPAGEGRNFANLDMRFPAIGTPDFLDVASDAFIRTTLVEGRPGRRMPGLAGTNGSLNEDELARLLDHLRARAPQPPSRGAVEAARSDRALAEQVYARDCASCHGRTGEGTVAGSPLATADAPARSRDRAYQALVAGVPDTAMPAYRAYDATTLRSLLDLLTTLSVADGSRRTWQIGAGEPEQGRPVYATSCAGCHGERGEGKTGPALANPGFLKAATPGYVMATTVRGRAGTPMPGFGRNDPNHRALAPQEVLDVTAFILSGLPAAREQAAAGPAATGRP